MSYSISWYLDPYILSVEYEGDVTLEEFMKAEAELSELCKGKAKVYSLVDMSRLGRVPLNISGLSKVFSGTSLSNRTALMFGHNMIMDVIGKSVVKLANINVHFVKDKDAGLKKIAELAPELSDLL
ncbi:MAG: hypothetical protein K8I82_12635 [Anaerolineae bacterium]|nr:hypothetical protein [Anaerolineae bacterium]